MGKKAKSGTVQALVVFGPVTTLTGEGCSGTGPFRYFSSHLFQSQ